MISKASQDTPPFTPGSNQCHDQILLYCSASPEYGEREDVACEGFIWAKKQSYDVKDMRDSTKDSQWFGVKTLCVYFQMLRYGCDDVGFLLNQIPGLGCTFKQTWARDVFQLGLCNHKFRTIAGANLRIRRPVL